MNKNEDLAKMKKNIGNVLGWGVGEWLMKIRMMLADILEEEDGHELSR